MEPMPEFMVELYVPKTECDALAVWADRVNRAAAELTAEDRPVRLLRSILVAEDETCFLLLEADRAETVRETARRAALAVERVVEATADLVNPDGRSTW
jgi:Nickel responsive protein SCO4226-like